MTDIFLPTHPRTVSGSRYRVPLDHPDCEQVGKVLDALYTNAALSPDERSFLIREYRRLRRVDKYFAIITGETPIPAVDIRPRRPDAYVMDHSQRDCFAGYFWRLHRYARLLSERHFGDGGGLDDI